jgi:hypothetical protein
MIALRLSGNPQNSAARISARPTLRDPAQAQHHAVGRHAAGGSYARVRPALAPQPHDQGVAFGARHERHTFAGAPATRLPVAHRANGVIVDRGHGSRVGQGFSVETWQTAVFGAVLAQ